MPKRSPLEQLEDDVDTLQWLVDTELTRVVGRIWLPNTRRLLMAVKDEILANLEEMKGKVRNQKTIEAGLRTTVTTLNEQAAALRTRIEELEAKPGPWTDADMEEIKAGVQAVEDALDAEAIVEAVMANTPAEGSAGEAGGSGNAG